MSYSGLGEHYQIVRRDVWTEERVNSLYYIGLWESVRPPVLSWFFHWDYTIEVVLLAVRLPVSGGWHEWYRT